MSALFCSRRLIPVHLSFQVLSAGTLATNVLPVYMVWPSELYLILSTISRVIRFWPFFLTALVDIGVFVFRII